MYDAIIKEGIYEICFGVRHTFYACLFNGRWHNTYGELIDLRSTPEKLCNEKIVRKVGRLPKNWWPASYESFVLSKLEKEM